MNCRAVFLAATSVGALLLGCGQQQAAKPVSKAPVTAVQPVPKELLAKADTPIEPALPDSAAEGPAPVVEPIAPAGRMILFTPTGPLVLELAVEIDGESLASARQKVVDEMVARLTSDAQGELTWEKALADPRFTLGENPRNRQDRRILIASVDANRDQLVQPAEAAEYLARLANIGPAFGFGVSQQSWSDREASAFWRRVDTDGDGGLSREEIDTIESSLRSLDADGDELIEASELAPDEMPARPQPGMAYNTSSNSNSKLAVLCDATFRGDSLAYTIDELYPDTDDSAPKGPRTAAKLVEALDANFNGRIDGREPLRLTEIEPHGRVEIVFGDTSSARPSVAIHWLDAELAKAVVETASPDQVDCQLAGDRLVAARQTIPADAAAMQQNALLGQFAALDKDSNGYLEVSELPEGNMNLQRGLRAADANNDGKLYREELEKFLAWQTALRSASVRLEVSSSADPLFAALDTSGDGRLSVREVRAAAAACRQLDQNQDETLELAELPATIRLNFSRFGYDTASDDATPDAVAKPASPSSDSAQPGWFLKMDLNRDGDLTPREFLGTPEQFQQLDVNTDGFIEAAEASAAK